MTYTWLAFLEQLLNSVSHFILIPPTCSIAIVLKHSGEKNKTAKLVRVPRALTFLGAALRSLAGTMDSRDRARIYKNFEILQNLMANQSAGILYLDKAFSGLARSTNERYNYLLDSLKVSKTEYLAMRNKLIEINKQLLSFGSDTATDLSHILYFIATLMRYQQSNALLEKIQGDQADQNQALQQLKHNRLPAELVHPKSLTNLLNRVTRSLARSGSGYKLTYDTLHYYYEKAETTSYYTDSKLLIHLRIPISRSDIRFKIYIFQFFPVPINPEAYLSRDPDKDRKVENPHDTGITLLHSKYQVLGINAGETLFVQLNQADLISCEQWENHYICPTVFTILKVKDHSSCLMAIYKNNLAQTLRFCDSAYHPYDLLAPRVLRLSPEEYFVSTSQTQLSLECTGQQPKNIYCGYCHIRLSCDCLIQGQDIFIPSRQEDCGHFKSKPVKIAVIQNLKYMAHFIDTELYNISMADFKLGINISLPNITLLNQPLQNSADYESSLRLNLTHMIKLAKEKKPIFLTSDDQLLHHSFTTQLHKSTFYAITAIQTLFAIVHALVTAYLFYRNRQMAAAIQLLETGPLLVRSETIDLNQLLQASDSLAATSSKLRFTLLVQIFLIFKVFVLILFAAGLYSGT